jgi:hypothetical protein
LIHPNFTTNDDHPLDILENCFYTGTIQDQPNSSVAASTCNGQLSALIDVEDKSFEIKPISSLNNFYHDMSQVLQSKVDEAESFGHNLVSDLSDKLTKRSFEGYFIELLIINDLSRVKSLGSQVNSVTMHLANMVSQKYKRDLGISVVVSSIYNSPQVLAASQVDPVDASYFLREAIKFTKSYQFPRHDHAQVISARDIYMDGNRSTNGLGRVGSVCTEESVSVVQALRTDSIEVVANTMAHELGHALNMPHDSTSASPCRNGIMEAKSCSNCSGAERKRFSSCSISIAQNFIRNKSCLFNKP